jgi:hypothetical protein
MWIVALVLLLQATLAPFIVAGPGATIPAPAQLVQQSTQPSCCDGPSCCCGDPDICLCVAECPDAPIAPAHDPQPARPADDRTTLAILPRHDALASPMAFSPRNRVVTRSTPRPQSTVRAQALLNIWLT